MRILHVITRLLRGGAEEKTLLEIEHLRREHEFELACGPVADPSSLARLEAVGSPHRVVPALKHYAPWAAPVAISQLRRLIRRGRYDAVHTHSTEAGLLAREAARRENVPRIVHTIHGLEFTSAHAWPVRRAVVAFHRRLAPATDRYFSNAQVLTDRFLDARIGTRAQYGLVRSGVDLEAARRASLVPLQGDPAVLAASRLEKNKGVDDLLQAAALLVSRWPGMHVTIAGDGPHRPKLKAQVARLGLHANVTFLGWRTDVPGLLKGASVFVLSSHREGTPRVVTQALAVGCPVVASRVDGIPEQLDQGEAGLLVPAANPAGLAEGLEATFSDPGAAKARARRGQVKAAEFSLPAMLASLRREYELLAKTPVAKPS